MATAGPQRRVGPLLREWRERRRLSQLELATDAGVSTRHLSFVETGRSKPGRELLLRISDHLDVPFRERNQLLLAAGHAPAFAERSLDDPELAPVRDALDLILEGHEPYPAVVFDRHWNVVAANAPTLALIGTVDVDPALLDEPVNAMRITFHPDGLAPLIVNLADWRAVFCERLAHQVAATGDSALAALLEEVAGYPMAEPAHAADRAPGEMLGPVVFRAPGGGELSFIGMFATFDTPFEVTTSELAIELLFPADPTTARAITDLTAKHDSKETPHADE